MGLRFKQALVGWFGDWQEMQKFLYLSFAFFFIIGGYTIAKEIKEAIFISIVGREYIPLAKTSAMLVLIPAIFLYSILVDSMRRYQLLAFYSALFGVLGLIFAWLLGHPTIGLSNTITSPYRIFGWILYYFVEGYSPFVVSVFWAFANSITSPDEAKRGYAFMVAISKIGGMLSAGVAWYLFSINDACSSGSCFDVYTHQLVLVFASCMLIVVPFIIFMLMKRVPGKYLHGYEAVYQAEKETGKERSGIFSGLTILVKYPYVFGIFGMIFFYEMVSQVVSYLRLGIAQSQSSNISGISAFLFKVIFYTHLVGFFFSLFGTSTLLKRFGERMCLMLIPLLSGAVLLYLMVTPTGAALTVAIIILKAINYAFAWPVRESLYIPTIKEIKFKSKSWIDAFGSKFAKASGSLCNFVITLAAPAMVLPIYSFFFAMTVTGWFLTAFFLGARFERAVARNEVIGLGEPDKA